MKNVQPVPLSRLVTYLTSEEFHAARIQAARENLSMSKWVKTLITKATQR